MNEKMVSIDNLLVSFLSSQIYSLSFCLICVIWGKAVPLFYYVFLTRIIILYLKHSFHFQNSLMDLKTSVTMVIMVRIYTYACARAYAYTHILFISTFFVFFSYEEMLNSWDNRKTLSTYNSLVLSFFLSFFFFL